MNRFYNLSLLFILMVMLGSIAGCKKEDALVVPPVEAGFTDLSTGSYFVKNDPNSQYKVPVGLTTVSASDTKVDITVTSPSGATEGTQYTIPSSTVIIPAGKVVDSFVVKGLFSGFPVGRKDTLILTISNAKDAASATPLISNDTFMLVMQGYCDVVLTSLEGAYTNCFDKTEGYPDYGPYSVGMEGGSVTSATTGTLTVDNFWDVGGDPIIIKLDWTDPSNFTTTVDDQFLYTDSRYGPARIRGVGKGKFSSCDESFTISYEVYVDASSFGNFITTISR